MTSITNGDVVNLLEELKGNAWLAAEKLFDKLEGFGVSKYTLHTKIRRLKKPKFSKTSAQYLKWFSSIFFSLYDERDQDPHDEQNQDPQIEAGPCGDSSTSGRGRPAKRLSDNPSRSTTERIMAKPVDYLVNFAKEQGIPLDDVIDILNERCPNKKRKNSSKIVIPPDEACAYFLNGGFSSRSWTDLRLFLLKFNVELPTRNTIDTNKSDYLPQVISHEIKCSVSYPELIQDTVLGLIQSENIEMNFKDGDSLELHAKTGIDGSGCHNVRHQCVNSELSLDENPHLDPSIYTNYLLCCMAPLSLSYLSDGEKVLLWKNPSPNAISYTRPISLIRAEESRVVVEKEFASLFSYINNDESFTIKISEKQIPLNVKNTVSMVDGKMVGILQGDIGSRKCHYCTSTVEDMNNVVGISQGYHINKDYNTCMEAWRKVEEGQVEWKSSEREGQCERPLVSVNNFSILHWKLRSFDFALNILYRLICGVYKWGKTGQMDKFISGAKQKAQDHIRQKLGLLIDVPTSGGGNTNNGSIATRYFDPKSRETVCELISNKRDRQNYEDFLRDLNVILTVCLGMRSGVNIEKLRKLGTSIMMHIRTSFTDDRGQPWIPVNPSLHAMCAHSWQLFDMSNGEAISIYSEQAQEHWNKNVRSYKSGCGSHARQHSVKLNLKDVVKRMLQVTHPVVVAKQRKLKCSICGQLGHTARSKAFHFASKVLGEDDKIINEMYS